jgi:hypothetical protein
MGGLRSCRCRRRLANRAHDEHPIADVSGSVERSRRKETRVLTGASASSFQYSGEATVSIDVTSFVNSLVGQPLASLEIDPAGPVPETVPEPATVALLGSTLAGIGLARWRQWRRKQSGVP